MMLWSYEKDSFAFPENHGRRRACRRSAEIEFYLENLFVVFYRLRLPVTQSQTGQRGINDDGSRLAATAPAPKSICWGNVKIAILLLFQTQCATKKNTAMIWPRRLLHS